MYALHIQWPASHKWTPEYIKRYIHTLPGVKYSSSRSFMYTDGDKNLKEVRREGEVLWDKANLTSGEFFDICANTHTNEEGEWSGVEYMICIMYILW